MERGNGEGSRACHKRRLLLLRCIAAAALVGDTAAFVRVAHVGLSLNASPAFVPAVPVLRTMRHAEALASQRRPSLQFGPRDMGRRMAVGSVCMVGAGQEDGLRIVEFGKNKGAREKGGDTSAQADSTEGTLSRDRTDVDAEVSRKAEVSKQTLDALSMASWWKHDPKHRTIVNEHDLVVDYDQMLGDGTYGEVFVANFISGKYKGKKAVAKRAKDGLQDPLDPVKYVKKERSKQMEEHDELAAAYLTTEGYVNDLVMESSPESCAPYLGMMTKQNKRWLVWEFLEGTTLEDLLLECDECYSLQPLARALGITDLVDGDMPSLRNLVNKIAIQLLSHCRSLEQAGLAHRDIKPFNIFVTNEKLLLIDFGSAAAMGIRERVGYDYNKSPCDPRYAPPEQFIDEEEWAKYDGIAAC
jgi:tRNA A-37 threonylcarbamoyl transferase component Bud32